MDSRAPWNRGSPNNLCPECGKQVEILNGDFRFSMDLHMQSHKSLDTITREIDLQMKNIQLSSNVKKQFKSSYSCPICQETVEILNNDISFSLQCHSQKHKFTNNVETRQEDKLSTTSSDKSKNSDNTKQKSNGSKCNTIQISILDNIFNSMAPGLKSHKGFILEIEKGTVVCNICNVILEQVMSVPEHLKTKLHEDNTILFLKGKLPNELHHMMEFVSFYGSNLCCNLCRCKIDLCSNNLYETIVNIMIHNASKDHLSKKTNCKSSDQCLDALKIVKALARINPLINNNQHLIDSAMQPQFKCTLCEKNISYNQNESILLNNFTSHLDSSCHNNSLKAASILKSFDQSSVPEKIRHNLIVSKGGIFCKVCNCSVEVNLLQVIAHVREAVSVPSGKKIPDLHVPLNKQTISTPSSGTNILPLMSINLLPTKSTNPNLGLSQTVSGNPLENKVDINILLKSLPSKFRNITYIVGNAQGQVTCLVCNRIIPPSTYNLTTHLNGKSHTKNEVASTKEKEAQAQFHSVEEAYDFLLKTDREIANDSNNFIKNTDGKHYLCKLCGSFMESSVNINVFKHNIYSHIKSKGHKNKSQLNPLNLQVQSNEVRNQSVKEMFQLLPPSLQQEKHFISKFSNGAHFSFFCSPCKLQLPTDISSLQEHLEGNFHKKTVENCNIMMQESGNNSVSGNEDLLENRIITDKAIKRYARFLTRNHQDFLCSLCNSIIKMSYEEQLLKENILSHMLGKTHKKNTEKFLDSMFNSLQHSDSVVRHNISFIQRQEDQFNCTLCKSLLSTSLDEESLKRNLFIHLTGNKHKNKLSELENNASCRQPVGNKGNTLLEELFKNLPPMFQEDIMFIKTSQIEGYLSCTLCNNIINPHYLRDHLEESAHIQERQKRGQDKFECGLFFK